MKPEELFDRSEYDEFMNQYRDSQLFKSVWTSTKALFSEKPQAWSTKKLQEVGK